MSDRREFVKLDVGYYDNPKVFGLLAAKRPLAVHLHLACIAMARQQKTDGIVSLAVARHKVVGCTQRDVEALMAAGLIYDLGDGRVEVHDYLEHQDSRAQIDARADAARTAAEKRWRNA